MSGPPPAPDLSAHFLDFPTAPLYWPTVFGRAAPVEIEVGPGKGLFLANAATARPDHDFFGIEVARKYARKAAERVAKRHMANVRVVAGDGRKLLADLVPTGSVQAVHIYFPDPWWKKRHKKRRVFCESFVGNVARVLVPGGDFHFATDVEEYFGVMQELMATQALFLPQPEPEVRDPEHDLDYLTNFERKYRIEGRPIFRAHYRRA